jgi:hypothetical protein
MNWCSATDQAMAAVLPPNRTSMLWSCWAARAVLKQLWVSSHRLARRRAGEGRVPLAATSAVVYDSPSPA